MIWYDMRWYDMIWYDMRWYDMIWYDMIWYDRIWYDMIWFDMIWYDRIWYDKKNAFNPLNPQQSNKRNMRALICACATIRKLRAPAPQRFNGGPRLRRARAHWPAHLRPLRGLSLLSSNHGKSWAVTSRYRHLSWSHDPPSCRKRVSVSRSYWSC